MKRITIVGGGYVGMAYAELLSEKNSVTVVDLSQDKVDAIERQRRENSGSESVLRATTNGKSAYAEADYVIIAVPTNPVADGNELDCSAVEKIIGDVLEVSDSAQIVIKSTVPVGFTLACAEKYKTDRIIFNPEFLRETSANEDCRHPERIVIGTVSGTNPSAEEYASILREPIENTEVPILHMTASEAEAVKLFSNTYLAMRVAFFNELDSFAEAIDLDTAAVIRGVCSDSRIGDYYNNPSFGYGGTCFPKDIKQLQSQVEDIQDDLIGSIDASNRNRQDRIADRIESLLADKGSVVGVYRLGMQSSSNNYRQSSVLEIVERLHEKGVTTVIYEPAFGDEKSFSGCDVIRDVDTFKKTSDLIITNRYDAVLDDVCEKVYTRDILFGKQHK